MATVDFAAQPEEREILRALAATYMGYATSPAQLETQKLWAALNNGNMQRPMVMIDQIPWHEMDVDGSLICKIAHPYWQKVECWLRQSIYKFEHMPVDMVLPPYMCLPRVLNDPAYNTLGIAIDEQTASTDQANDVVSHGYINQFEDMEDVEKIKFTDLSADETVEAAVWEQAQQIFAGIALCNWEGVNLHLGLWDRVSEWMNVEECYYALCDQPELLHAIMERVTQVATQWIASGNKQGLFDTATAICHCSCTLRAPFAQQIPFGTSQNSWAFGMAQLFTSVAPATTKEFEVDYMKRLFCNFGDMYYGCCERLDDRLDVIMQLPNVRKISCSPWSDREKFAEKLPKHIILSNKPNPAMVGAGAMDETVIRKDLQRTMAAAKANGIGMEMILKDNSSVQYQPQRLWEFSKIAMEEVARW